MLWFDNDGGPLLVAPRSTLGPWEGGDPPSGGRTISVDWHYDPDGPATDYDRACAVNEPAGVVEIGESWGVVVTAEGSATWLDASVLATVLVAEDSSWEKLQELLRAVPSTAWDVLVPSAVVDGDGVLLLHAASTVRDVQIRVPSEQGRACIGEAILNPIPAGRYCIDYASRATSDVSEVGFLRFRPLTTVAA